MNEQTPSTLADFLAKAAAEVNARGNGQFSGEMRPPPALVPFVPPVGAECAQRIRDSGQKTAEAIKAQAAERVAVAQSLLEEALALEGKAKAIADDVIARAEEAAKNAIKIATHQNELIDVLTATTQKHASQ